MSASNRREELYDNITAYIKSDGDDLQSYVVEQLEETSAESLAIPQSIFDELVRPTGNPADAWDAFEPYLIDHQTDHICSSCGASCEAVMVDNGGQNRHVDLIEVSECCEEKLV